jgi:divalent metal cation (Fe/Co/Zn/Cd) transporter
MYIGADQVLLTLDAEFDPRASAADIAAAIKELEGAIRERFDKITRIYIEAVPTVK